MSRSKEEILATKNWSREYPNYMAESEIHDAMDEYMKESVLDAFSFLAKHNVECEVDTEGKEVFYYKGELVSKEELFQNFL